MAEKKSKRPVKVDSDPIVSRLLGEEHKPVAGLICIGGFVGQSPLANHVRLFTKIDFSECLDIPEDAIVGQEKVRKPGIPDGTYIWLKRNTVLSLAVVDPIGEVSTFLQGPILRHTSASKMKLSGRVGAGGAGFFSTPICSIIVSVATVTLLLCTRVECPDPTDDCPEPDPPPTFTEDPESVIV